MAHDGQTQTGAAGRAAAGLVDPVEALEDPLEVALGDADTRGPGPRWPAGRRRGGPAPRRRRRGRSTSRRCRAGCRGPRRSGGGRRTRRARGSGSATSMSMPACSAPGRIRSTASAMATAATTGSCSGASSLSMRLSTSRSSMVRSMRKASSTMRSARRRDTTGSSSMVSVSASSPMRPHRRLELVADVGHEVAAGGVEPPPLGDVVDHGQGAVVERHGGDDQRAARRAEQLDGSIAGHPGQRLGHQLVDRGGHQRVAVAGIGERLGHAVAEHHRPGGVGDEHTLRDGVQGPQQAGAELAGGGAARRPPAGARPRWPAAPDGPHPAAPGPGGRARPPPPTRPRGPG